jgi:hypothetical protein
MHFVQPLSAKAAAPRAATAVPHFVPRQQRPLTDVDRWRSQSSYTKLSSISPRDLRRSILPAVSHIPHATKDEDAIADAQLASAEAFMPEVWPDFSKMKVDPDIEDEFFNRKEEYDMIMEHLNSKPKQSLLLLGPKNGGKSVSHAFTES